MIIRLMTAAFVLLVPSLGFAQSPAPATNPYEKLQWTVGDWAIVAREGVCGIVPTGELGGRTQLFVLFHTRNRMLRLTVDNKNWSGDLSNLKLATDKDVIEGTGGVENGGFYLDAPPLMLFRIGIGEHLKVSRGTEILDEIPLKGIALAVDKLIDCIEGAQKLDRAKARSGKTQRGHLRR